MQARHVIKHPTRTRLIQLVQTKGLLHGLLVSIVIQHWFSALLFRLRRIFYTFSRLFARLRNTETAQRVASFFFSSLKSKEEYGMSKHVEISKD